MTEPSSHDAQRTGDVAADPERDAKIDELLLAGLEHYFAGRHQESINVWGRVLFLDRSHARARAYIDRARSALAERQRQSEELLQAGVAAIRRGDDGAARALLQSAAAQADSPDVALAYLDRLERLADAAVPAARPRQLPRQTRRLAGVLAQDDQRPRLVRTWPLVATALVIGTAIVVASAFDLLKPLVDASWGRAVGGPVVVVAPEPLPLPRSSELTLARARALASTGHVRDALTLLDRVPAGDPSFAVADQLRGALQRQLLAAPSRTAGGPPE